MLRDTPDAHGTSPRCSGTPDGAQETHQGAQGSFFLQAARSPGRAGRFFYIRLALELQVVGVICPKRKCPLEGHQGAGPWAPTTVLREETRCRRCSGWGTVAPGGSAELQRSRASPAVGEPGTAVLRLRFPHRESGSHRAPGGEAPRCADAHSCARPCPAGLGGSSPSGEGQWIQRIQTVDASGGERPSPFLPCVPE